MSDAPAQIDKNALRAKLKGELMTAAWLDFKEHLERDGIFLISPELDILDVGVGVASDDVEAVTAWLHEGLLTRPTSSQAEQWASEAGRSFRFLIVAPHILIQEPGH